MVAYACLLSDSSDGVVQLTITPEALARACEEAELGLLTPEDAEARFITSVSAVYASRILRDGQSLLALRSPNEHDVPYSTGFLALTVLAAFHMHTDGDYTAAAYYPRLAEMLGCGLIGAYPAGFDRDDYVALWFLLNGWLKRHFRRRLALPDVTGSTRRYLSYPLAHVPLREVDIQRLPQFFAAYGYEPGMRPSRERLAFDLVERGGPWRYLTKPGQMALQDLRRRPFVVRQVAHELEHWDGSRIDSAGNRIASIELWMDIKKRRPELHLIARRPSGFPATLRSGEYVFEASHEGWYEAVPLGRNDGALLSEGLRVASGHSQVGFSVQLRGCYAVPLTPSSEYPGYVSDHALRADTPCAVLCMEEAANDVERHLERVSGEQVRAHRDETLPIGWRLFTGVRPVNVTSPPLGLETLAVESDVRVVCEGGLRLGRRWTWLEDVPARVRVIGSRAGLVAMIDGHKTEIDQDGYLAEGLLAKRGEHVIEIGNRIRRKAVVVPGRVHPDCQPWPQDGEHRLPFPLPEGSWFVVGSEPGESLAVITPPGGAAISPDFRARWAIRVGAGAGATAIHIHDKLSNGSECIDTSVPKDRSLSKSGFRPGDFAARTWAETIYQANIRRPMLGCSFGCSRTEVAKVWRQIAARARTWKRQLKR